MAMREAFTVGIVLAAKDMYSGVMAKAQRNLGILRKTSTKSADAFEKSMKRYQAITAVGATVSVVSGQISGKIQEMTTDAIDFSAAMGKIGTVVLDNLGKFKSHQAAMEAWRKTALNLSTRSLFSATELINDASYELMSSGLNAEEAMNMLESVSTAAIATVANLEATSGIFGSIMNTFGRRWDMSSMEKGTRIMDVLAGAVKEFQWTGDVLAEGLSYATASATTMNVPLEDAVAILGMLNSKGVKGTKAGTALDATYRELTKSSKSFGISIEDVNGDLLPMPEILEKINNKLKGMGAVKKAATILKYFGQEGGKAINLLLENSEQLKAYIEDLQKSGIAAKMAAERMGTLSAEVKTQEHRWQNLRIELGDRAAPVMLGLKKGVLELVDVLGEIPHAKAFAGTILGIIGMAAEIGKTIGPALTMVGVLGMWRTQAKLAAVAQASLNKQMGIGAATSGTQAMKMGRLGSKGGTLVGVLGRVAAVGAVAFIGWEVGTILREVLNLDEATQNFLATLSGKDITDRTQKDFDKLSDIDKQIKKDIRTVTKEQMEFYVSEERKIFKGTTPEFIEWMKRRGVKPEYVMPFLPEKKGIQAGMIAQPTTTHPEDYERYLKNQEKRVKIAEEKATGIVGLEVRAKVSQYESEETRPRSMAGGTTITNYFGDIILPQAATGSAQMDTHSYARALIQEINRRMKIEGKRQP